MQHKEFTAAVRGSVCRRILLLPSVPTASASLWRVLSLPDLYDSETMQTLYPKEKSLSIPRRSLFFVLSRHPPPGDMENLRKKGKTSLTFEG